MLIQSIAKAHAHATMHLTFGGLVVDDPSGVMDVDDVQYLDVAHGDIHFDLGETDPKGVGVVTAVMRLLSRDVC